MVLWEIKARTVIRKTRQRQRKANKACNTVKHKKIVVKDHHTGSKTEDILNLPGLQTEKTELNMHTKRI